MSEPTEPTLPGDPPAVGPSTAPPGGSSAPDGPGVDGPGVQDATQTIDPVPSGPLAPESGLSGGSAAPASGRPGYLFFGVVAALALAADVLTKAWAEITLSQRTLIDPSIVIVKGHLSLALAYNKGGAWGLLQTASEAIRKPFFLVVSVLAIAFIVSLYARLGPGQRALEWGLPLVLGGALGNLSDRIVRSSVVDFVDYKAHWVEVMNRGISHVFPTWSITDHWPTFNVADICICIGVGLMAIDMFTSRRQPKRSVTQVVTPAAEGPSAGSGDVGLAAESVGVAGDPPSMG